MLGERQYIFFESVACDELTIFLQNARIYGQHKLNLSVCLRGHTGEYLGNGGYVWEEWEEKVKIKIKILKEIKIEKE